MRCSEVYTSSFGVLNHPMKNTLTCEESADLLRGGVDRLERGAALGVNKLIVDEELRGHGERSDFHL